MSAIFRAILRLYIVGVYRCSLAFPLNECPHFANTNVGGVKIRNIDLVGT